MGEHPKIRIGDDGALLLGFGEHGHQVDVAALSGDGRRVLTVREVGVAEVWDARTGSPVGRIAPDSPLRGSDAAPSSNPFAVFIESAALDRDGTHALLGLNDGTAAIFRVEGGARLAWLHPPDATPASEWQVVRAVAFVGPHAVVGFDRRRVGVWSSDGARRIAWLESPAGAQFVHPPAVRDTLVCSLAGSPDGRWIFAGHVDLTASLWDLRDGSLVFEALEHAEETLAVFAGPTGCGWATSAGSVWLAPRDQPARKLLATGERWIEVVVRGESLLARGLDGSVTQWSFSGERRLLHPGPSDTPRSSDACTLALTDDAVVFPDSSTRIVVLRGDRRTAIERADRVVTARLSPTGDAIATAGWLDRVELWSLADGALLRTFPARGVGDFALSRDGSAVAIGELGQGGGRYPRSLLVYATTTGARTEEHAVHDWQISRVVFSPAGDRIAALGHDLALIERATGRLVTRLDLARATADLHYLPDGRLLALDDGRVHLIAADGTVRSFPAPFAYGSTWSVDGTTLQIGLRQAIFRLDLDTGAHELRQAAIARPESFPSAALQRRARFHVGCAVWRTDHGLFIHQSDGPRGWMQPLALSGTRVAVPTADGAAIVDLAGEPTITGTVPFAGRLRASAIVAGEVLLVNDDGRLFRAADPTRDSR